MIIKTIYIDNNKGFIKIGILKKMQMSWKMIYLKQ